MGGNVKPKEGRRMGMTECMTAGGTEAEPLLQAAWAFDLARNTLFENRNEYLISYKSGHYVIICTS